MIKNNEYFGGNVKSLGYVSANGSSTVGVMEEGEYEFNTGAPERMTVIEGVLEVQLKNETEINVYKNGESFEVAANSSFKVCSSGQTSYLCEFL